MENEIIDDEKNEISQKRIDEFLDKVLKNKKIDSIDDLWNL